MTYKDMAFCTAKDCANLNCGELEQTCTTDLHKQPEFTTDYFCEGCGRRIASGTYCSNCEDQEW